MSKHQENKDKNVAKLARLKEKAAIVANKIKSTEATIADCDAALAAEAKAAEAEKK